MKTSNPQTYFRLHPIKAAKVSEISEATAASPVKPEDRINFHIGNPVQDTKLIKLYQKLVFEQEQSSLEINKDSDWNELQTDQLELISKTIEQVAPYMPRGGFTHNNPNQLALLIKNWFTQNKFESLEYDLGTESGRKEIIFTIGGIWESLRILFHSLSHYLFFTPANIFTVNINLVSHLHSFPALQIHSLSLNDDEIIPAIKTEFSKNGLRPTFLILGKILNEDIRRKLRKFSQKKPLYFIEVNNAPNHLSLAREAGLLNKVIRLITPSAINSKFVNIAVTFIAGNADFLKIMETIHFELKGTPPVTEINLLSYLFSHKLPKDDNNSIKTHIESKLEEIDNSENNYFQSFEKIISNTTQLIEKHTNKIVNRIEEQLVNTEGINTKIQRIINSSVKLADPFSNLSVHEIINNFFNNIDNINWLKQLEQGFLSAFNNIHQEYSTDNCFIISGSTRTALSLLGFHSGIEEIITPDLSWTYEHCFPRVETVSLKNDLSLDAHAIIDLVKTKQNENSAWRKKGAVVLNNPHNASGQIFDEKEITKLLIWLLQNKIFVIDDLAYQYVAPSDKLTKIRTLRQIANILIKKGKIRKAQIQYLTSVHSLSKTDCFAGGRLTVMEILHTKLFEKY